MLVFEVVIGLLLLGTALAALARRIATPYPALLALAGAALAFVPGAPTLVLDPELALTLFVAPVLLDAAFDASQRDLRANWRSIASLALGAVALTVVVVAVIARMLVPDMPWAVAIALGAIVAPPDAAAATAVLRQLKPPHQLLVILEGESLFNDASALLIYRVAVGAVVVGAFSGWSVVPTLIAVGVGSVVLAFVLSRVLSPIVRHINDIASAIIVQFCTTFAVWILAEQLHLSGILTMVVYAMLVSRAAGPRTPPRIRIPSFAAWEVGVFVLNVLAFILVGFQLKDITSRIDQATLIQYSGIAAVVCAVTILARILWVTLAAAATRWLRRRRGTTDATDKVTLSAKSAAVVAWCGMRGVVTLATALALPTGGEEGGAVFPYRDMILFIAFAVVLGTLVLQGMTLRPLIAWLQLRDDGEIDNEVRLARVATLKAGLSSVPTSSDSSVAEFVRRRHELLLRRAKAEYMNAKHGRGVDDEDARRADEDAQVIRAVVNAKRQKLFDLRNDGTISDTAFQLVEQDLDLEELDIEQVYGEHGYDVVR